MSELSKQQFNDVFMQNITRRSRSLRAKDSGAVVSPYKPNYRVTGKLLQQILEFRASTLCEVVWEVSRKQYLPLPLQCMSDRWYETLSEPSLTIETPEILAHTEELRSRLDRLKKHCGRIWYASQIDPRYRTWNISYGYTHPSPYEIQAWMESFFHELSHNISRIKTSPSRQSLVRILAWTDFELDKVIHPWQDQCGRHATAFVMWLALCFGEGSLPFFGTHEEHYKAMSTLDDHIAYYDACLKPVL